MLETVEGYSLSITEVAIPFALLSYEISPTSAMPECFNVFLQAVSSPYRRDLGCFVLYGNLLGQRIKENIIEWLIQHPSTIRKQEDVIEQLMEVRTFLENKGPIPHWDIR